MTTISFKRPFPPLPLPPNSQDTPMKAYAIDEKTMASLTEKLTVELASERRPINCRDKWVVVERRKNRIGESVMAVSIHKTSDEALLKAKTIFAEMDSKMREQGGRLIGTEKEGEFVVASYGFTTNPHDLFSIGIMVAQSFE